MAPQRSVFWSERRDMQGSVVFAGDSLTAGWSTLQQDFSGMRVANRGIGGDVSRGLLFRFDEDVLALRPRGVVLLIGANDLTARQDAAVTLANIRAMVDQARAQMPGTPLLVCTVPASANPAAPVDRAQLKALNDALRAFPKHYPNVFLVDLFAATATAQGDPERRYFHEDRLHLSAAGHARWKEALEPVMRQAGLM